MRAEHCVDEAATNVYPLDYGHLFESKALRGHPQSDVCPRACRRAGPWANVRLWMPTQRLRLEEMTVIEGVNIRGRLVNTMLGPHERTPSWEGEDVFTVRDVLPFPKSLA